MPYSFPFPSLSFVSLPMPRCQNASKEWVSPVNKHETKTKNARMPETRRGGQEEIEESQHRLGTKKGT
jgi:hypothetical protein